MKRIAPAALLAALLASGTGLLLAPHAGAKSCEGGSINAAQCDMDGDGISNKDDDDIDGDGIPNADDSCPRDASNTCADDDEGTGGDPTLPTIPPDLPPIEPPSGLPPVEPPSGLPTIPPDVPPVTPPDVPPVEPPPVEPPPVEQPTVPDLPAPTVPDLPPLPAS